MLAPHNVIVDGINSRILGMLKTKEKIYLSTDESLIERPFDINAADDEEEALNKFNPSGLPLHELKLKEGAIIVLLKNLAVARGLVNGTRMVVKSLHDNIIMAEVITGTNAGTGKQVCLNRCWCE
jgi:ATP-dependent DNA helicase PIF1